MTENSTIGTRPRWSASEAARRCGVGRATIQRALDGGKLPGAVKTEDGWQIPLEDLLAAGFKPDRPAPPDEPAKDDNDDNKDPAGNSPNVVKLTARVHELETELVVAKTRAESEAARRAAAEQLAQERLERVSDLRTALRMLETAKPAAAAQPQPAAGGTAAAPMQTSTVVIAAPRHRRRERRRTFREWWADRKADTAESPEAAGSAAPEPQSSGPQEPASAHAGATVIEADEIIETQPATQGKDA
ncbi:helix-turn-helix domain-containing protein [Hoyosella sp. YIM 151337]|uniref:helix-turn-helix domain-containing protein n=1 Tax=Hoyosella sp. YIM 151337 TaxID=2992742 RepID=UPI0022354967|nr:helix-turn-helix domain-containing protein [Hoyosella sp. YIM 151337]MCW4354780.1 helix-turn-helix domain-containing protein [Hoyosella sp. YIM 151337]